MGETTGIGWTDHTWSPWWGCTKVSPACDHCYAEALDKRTGGAHWGSGAPRKEMSEAHWKAPLRWSRQVPEGETRFVFPSMCDPFDNEVPVEWRQRFFDLIRATPNLTWLLLTKRIGNAGKMADVCGGLPPNVAVGATVVTQDELDRDIGKLVAVKDLGGARFVFLSIEPMLEAMDLYFALLFKPDWVIVGGESGPSHRPINAEWVRRARDQCKDAGVPFFFKQWGGRTPKANGKTLDGREWCDRPRV